MRVERRKVCRFSRIHISRKFHPRLSQILNAAGMPLEDAETVAGYMVSANLAGHDSHGIIQTKVMLDRDLAELYEVETKVLKQAVRRNTDRFPEDFMFELTTKELDDWRSQFVTSKSVKKGLRHKPMAFTEQGVAMLSSVLRSGRAIQVNIQIMRAFTKLRQLLSTHEGLKKKIEAMEKKYDQQFQVVFEAIRQLLETEAKPRKKIGFMVKESRAAYGKHSERNPI